MKLTPSERKMLENIGRNNFANGDPRAWVWSDSLDEGPHPIPAASFGGLVASLVKKGLAETDGNTGRDAAVRLTEAGVAELGA